MQRPWLSTWLFRQVVFAPTTIGNICNHSLFYIPQPPGASQGLHLVACAVVVCSEQQHQQQHKQGLSVSEICAFGRGSFASSRVSVSLTMNSDRTTRNNLRGEPFASTANDSSFLFLPMAANSLGRSFSPEMLQVNRP
jgi:hypothetical protein